MNESICTGQNDVRLNEAEEHVVALEGQAGEFGSILTDAKEPAARSLEAAQAYDNIAKAMAEADERAQEARNDAEASPILRPRHACCMHDDELIGVLNTT